MVKSVRLFCLIALVSAATATDSRAQLFVANAVFRLRQNTNLTTTNWTVVTNIPVVVGGGTTNQIRLRATNATFFDLVNP